MTTATYNLEGTDYPIIFNWNAMSDFLERCNMGLADIDNLAKMTGKQITIMFHSAFAEAARIAGKEFPYTAESLGAVLSVRDITGIIGIYTAHTTADVQTSKKK